MKRFILCLAVVAVFAAPMLLLSVVCDPYSVFHPNDVKITKIESNSNYIKTKYILSHKDKFNAFIFGSSRAGTIDPERIESNRFYNMYYSEGQPSENVENLKAFVKSGVEVREILLVIDNIAPFIDPETHRDQDIRRPFRYGQIDAVFLAHYLNPAKTIKSFQIVSPFEEKLDNSEYYSKGWICHLEDRDAAIEADPAAHAARDVFGRAKWGTYFTYRGDAALEDLRELVEFCGKNSIKLTACACPLYRETYIRSAENGYLDYLSKIADITPFYSFVGLNEITNSPYYYYENSHYRRIVGDMIVDRIYGGAEDPALLAQGFGVYVDKTNSDMYIEALKNQLEAEKK